MLGIEDTPPGEGVVVITDADLQRFPESAARAWRLAAERGRADFTLGQADHSRYEDALRQAAGRQGVTGSVYRLGDAHLRSSVKISRASPL